MKRSLLPKATIGLIAILGIIFFAYRWIGKPSYSVDEKEERLYLRGQELLKLGKPKDAFNAFSNLLEQRYYAPNTHLEIAQLYLNIHNDPIYAIYHFREYLAQDPGGKLANMVVQMIDSAKKEFIRTLPMLNKLEDSTEYLNLLEILKQVRRENERLKLALTKSKSNRKASKVSDNMPYGIPNDTVKTETKNHMEASYAVEAGDTLSKISLKVYKNSALWRKIFNANRDLLATPNSLKIGMELTIPPMD